MKSDATQQQGTHLPAPGDPTLIGQIHHVRGKDVMLDVDLAEIYGVSVSSLNQAYVRNVERFPAGFSYRLKWSEVRNLKSQFVISSSDHGGRRHPPRAFTEQGALMLSNVLRSDRAVKASISIVNAFVEMRKGVSSLASPSQGGKLEGDSHSMNRPDLASKSGHPGDDTNRLPVQRNDLVFAAKLLAYRLTSKMLHSLMTALDEAVVRQDLAAAWTLCDQFRNVFLRMEIDLRKASDFD